MALLYALIFGIAVFILSYYYMQRFFDWLRFQSIGTRDYVVEKLNLMFVDTTPGKVLFWMTAAAVGPFLLVFLFFLPKVLPGLLFGALAAVVGWKAPKPVVNFLFQRRIDKFNLQMVDGLNLMANAMKSGLSIIQSLSIVVEQMPNPIAQEFNLVLSQNKVGVSVEDAFTNLSKRVSCEDVDMFVTAINILKETGGNLAETLETIVFVIRERIKVESKIKAMTAQGRIQGYILMAIPPALGAYLGLSDPGFMDPLFNRPLGWVIIGAVLILEIAAYYTINRVVKIDV
ncbi:MAG: type II secretion system F family protein [Deltaproteobacteria bacterium]|nr:type II secretion system F family protein [Deltaproteobacteria bacterium]